MVSFKLLNGSTLIILLAASLIYAQNNDLSANFYTITSANTGNTCGLDLRNELHPPPEQIQGALEFAPPSNQNVTRFIVVLNCNDTISKNSSPSAIILNTNSSYKSCNNYKNYYRGTIIPLFTIEPNCLDSWTGSKGQIIATISEIQDNSPTSLPTSPPPSSQQSTNDNNNKMLATYQTAMIVLYAVSGVVLGLFFIVVVTNIIRNRLNASASPTSQGQDPTTRPRRGIARSVLDSFPVFFFSIGSKDDDDNKEKDDLEKGKTKELESDIELEAISSDVMKSAPQAEETKDKEDSDASTDDANNNNNNDNSQENIDLPKNPPLAHIKDSLHGRSASTSSNPSTTLTNDRVQEGQLTCPICLGDFESGEELRLLPCQHQYHKLCIDPWLLDISPLCPMCKTDYTSWENDMNANQLNQDSSGSSSAESAVNNNENQQNDGDNSSVASSVHHNFPHFRWIKYLTAIRKRRRNRDRRSSRQSRTVELGNNNNNNSSRQDNNNATETVITG